MTRRLGVVMDPIGSVKVAKDSTVAMLLAAQSRGWELTYMELGDLHLADGEALAHGRTLTVRDGTPDWFTLGPPRLSPLSDLDVILMRKDPPVDMEYVYASHILERAEAGGVLVVNKPASLRDANEKLYTAWFPQCCPPTLVSRKGSEILEFLAEQSDIIVKPLGAMGGASVFRVRQGDPNTNVILETMTAHGKRYTMTQRFVPEIAAGDKRILVIEGRPVPYALARIPPPGETRGNLAVGGRGSGVPLNDRDYWICEQIGAILREKGLMFVGLDVIGDYLTEINVTSPTCIRELDQIYDLDIASDLMDAIEARLHGP